MKCLACDSEAIVSGSVLDKSSGGISVFKFDAISVWKSLFGVGTRRIKAYGCVNCGNLQFAVDFSDKDVQSFRQFEGQQPGILERLASDSKDRES